MLQAFMNCPVGSESCNVIGLYSYCNTTTHTCTCNEYSVFNSKTFMCDKTSDLPPGKRKYLLATYYPGLQTASSSLVKFVHTHTFSCTAMPKKKDSVYTQFCSLNHAQNIAAIKHPEVVNHQKEFDHDLVYS